MKKIQNLVLSTILITSPAVLTSCGGGSDSQKSTAPTISLSQELIENANLRFVDTCDLTKSNNKAIYGSDSRQDICSSNFKYDNPEKMKAVAMFVEKSQLIYAGSIEGKMIYKVNSQTLEDSLSEMSGYPVCSSMKYKDEVAPGFCTGFLIDENGRNDELMTAGHCLEGSNVSSIRVLFTLAADGRKVISDNSTYAKDLFVTEDQIFSIEGNQEFSSDMTIATLNREVLNVEPLEITRKAFFKEGEELEMLGHPSGLTMKVAQGVVKSDEIYSNIIQAHISSFGGNSGSPVFDKASGKVAGILVSGQQDYELSYDYGNYCISNSVYTRYDTGGESILKARNYLD